ncbi:MAG TPA: hypothetical protein VNJ02_17400 [Vicinamibacterales bacterium]|nr:hypothetical protein [Vicinamibacterales bacterium]
MTAHSRRHATAIVLAIAMVYPNRTLARVASVLLSSIEAHARREPFALKPVIEVDTTESVDAQGIARRVRVAWSRGDKLP